MTKHLASDEQIIALRTAAVSLGDLRTVVHCGAALTNNRDARAFLTGVINGAMPGTDDLSNAYHRALDARNVVLVPEVQHESERTAWASRGHQSGAGFVSVGVRVLGEVCRIDVPNTQDRATALRFLEMHLLDALADVRELRRELQAEESRAGIDKLRDLRRAHGLNPETGEER